MGIQREHFYPKEEMLMFVKEISLRSVLVGVFSIAIALSFLYVEAFSQATSGSIGGTLTDPSGAVIPNASVKATEAATGVSRDAMTSEHGTYVVPRLAPGKYDLQIMATGFKLQEFKDVEVRLGVETTVNAALTVGGSSETLVVTADAQLVETNTAQATTVFENKKIEELPYLTGRLDSIAYLSPGVVTGLGSGNTNGADISVNGQRQRSNNFTIDGQDNNDISVTGPSLFMSNIDVVQEFSIITNNFSAEYGRNQGAIINIVTKSGTNDLHGSVYGYHTNSFFASNSYDNNRDEMDKPRSNDNTDGFTIGGPLKKDRIFYFGYFQIEKGKSISHNSSASSVITPAGLTELQKYFPNSIPLQVYQDYGPFSRPLGNPVILDGSTGTKTITMADVNEGNPISYEVGQITRSVSTPYDGYDFGNKWDFHINSNNVLNVRLLYQNTKWGNQMGSAAGYEIDVPGETWNTGATYSHLIGATASNELRFNYGRISVMFEGGNTYPFSELGSNLSNIDMPSGYLDFGLSNTYPQGRELNTYQFMDNFLTLKGRHTLKTGFDIRYQNTTSKFSPNANGRYAFTSFEKFINNVSNLYGAAGNTPIKYTETDYFGYFQDDFKIKPNLTINLGIRYEFTGQPMNRLNELTVDREANPDTALWDTTMPLSARTVPALESDNNNWAPRFGFAYTPKSANWLFGNDATVFRGGYSIAYDPAFYNIMLNVASSAPNVSTFTLSSVAMPAEPTGTNMTSTFAPPKGGDPRQRYQTQMDPSFHSPYAQNWTFGMQRQLGRDTFFEVRYVGTRGVSLFQSLNGNPLVSSYIDNGFSQYIPSGITAAANGRVLGDYATIRKRANTAGSTYHGLQTAFNGQIYDQLHLSMSYTWSHAIDNVSEIFGYLDQGSVAIAQNPFDINAGERGHSNIDIPHVWTANFTWDLPWMKSQANWLGKVFGGWEIAGIYRLTSGRPMTPVCYYCGNSTTDQSFNANAAGLYDSFRPFVSNPDAPVTAVGQYVSANELVDFQTGDPTTADKVHFIINDDTANQIMGTPFGIGRNTYRAGIFSQGDFSMYKKFKLKGERISMQLRWEVTNIFNTPFLGTPDVYIDDAGMGFMDATMNYGIENRDMVFGLRIIF
jgi:hypothetical protein